MSIPDVQFQQVQTNGVSLRVALKGDGPLCVLLHGWPELWLSWRHQIEPLANAGYRVAVPDVRGYGGSDAPPEVEAYGMRTLAADVAGLVEALGEESAILIGHDWGAPIAAHTALLHPERVRALVTMSVPHLGRSAPYPPTEVFKAMYPDRFFYILYFQRLDVPEAEFEQDIRSSLAKIYYANSGDVTAEVRKAVRARTPKSGYLEGMVVPDPLPEWLTDEDLDIYAEAYARSGFRGGINRYRNMDRDWHDLPELDDMKIEQPSMFLAGEHDSVLRYAVGMNLMDAMDPYYTDLRRKEIIPGAGHWVQQERPNDVNAAVLGFLRSLA
ncbi:MAG: alpha/beta hydrolase [Myxococcota bacterium]